MRFFRIWLFWFLALIALPFQLQCSRFSRDEEFRPPPGDVALGMSMNEVRNVWGDPGHVATAGNTPDGNERWTYSVGVSSIAPTRHLYFEEGKLIGWETVGDRINAQQYSRTTASRTTSEDPYIWPSR